MTVPKTYRLYVASVARDLPVIEVVPGISIAVMNLLGDAELAEAAGQALAKLVPPRTEALVMPDGKALALAHVMQRELDFIPTVIARKRRVSYMREPVLDMTAVSITTQSPHRFFLGADEVEKLRGKEVVIVDDVVSTGGTLMALQALLEKAGAKVIGVMAVGTEGDPRSDVIALHHFPVFKTSGAV